MVGWLGAAAVAAVGGLKIHGTRWRQVPYIGGLAAMALFIGWKLLNRDEDDIRSPEEEPKTDVASKDILEVYEGEEKLDSGGSQPGIPDPESQRWTSPSIEEILKPGDLPDCPLDLDKNQVGLDYRNSDTSLTDMTILSVRSEEVDSFDSCREDLDNFVSSREESLSNSENETVKNLPSAQVVEDVKSLREIRKSFTAVGSRQVDEVGSQSGPGATNLKAQGLPILLIKTGKSKRVFPTEDFVPGDREETILPHTGSGKDFKEVIKPEQDVYLTNEDGEKHISQFPSTGPTDSPSSSASSVDYKPAVADVWTSDTEHSLPRGDECSEMNSCEITYFSPDHEVLNSGNWEADNNLNVTPIISDDTAKCSGTAAPDRSAFASPNGIPSPDGSCATLQERTDNEQKVQSPRSVQGINVETDDEVSNSARHEYSERLRSYDEYLADPELSPTMRSQVLRAKASIARYLDDSDDDQ